MSQREPFTHLPREDIKGIVLAFSNGEAPAEIARRFSIHRKTVHYHLRKYRRSYPENPNVYALIKTSFRKSCSHPSMKCFLCGTAADHIHAEELSQIRDLTTRLERANARLKLNGLAVE